MTVQPINTLESESTTTHTVNEVEEEVPLVVDQEVETIEEEETPLASLEDQLVARRIWWSWIPIVGAAISSKEGIDKAKKKDEEEESDKD